jgi:hypothetical protein
MKMQKIVLDMRFLFTDYFLKVYSRPLFFSLFGYSFHVLLLLVFGPILLFHVGFSVMDKKALGIRVQFQPCPPSNVCTCAVMVDWLGLGGPPPPPQVVSNIRKRKAKNKSKTKVQINSKNGEKNITGLERLFLVSSKFIMDPYFTLLLPCTTSLVFWDGYVVPCKV